MSLFKHKNASKEDPVYVVVYRNPRGQGWEIVATHDTAMDAFEAVVSRGYVNPYERRRMFVTGPDYCVQPDDPDDPLLVGDAALRAVLTPAEYAALVQAPVAAALLES